MKVIALDANKKVVKYLTAVAEFSLNWGRFHRSTGAHSCKLKIIQSLQNANRYENTTTKKLLLINYEISAKFPLLNLVKLRYSAILKIVTSCVLKSPY